MKKVLITGGAGFIGSHLANRLIDDGYDVVVIDNLVGGNKDRLSEKVNFFKLDIRDKLSDFFEEQRFDILIHLAAQSDLQFSKRNPFIDLSVNLYGSYNMAELCKKSGIRRVLFASSCAVYGETENEWTEDLLPDPLAPYAVHKRAFEIFLSQSHFLFTAFRLGNVFGEYMNKGVINNFAVKKLQRKPLLVYNDGEQTRDFIYVKDVVDAFSKAIEQDAVGTYNIGSGKPITVNQLAAYFNQPINFVSRVGEVKKVRLNIDNAKKVLNWQPKSDFEKFILLTIKYYEENQEDILGKIPYRKRS